MRKILLTFIFILITGSGIYAGDNFSGQDSIEVYLIDSFVSPEKPHKFMLSFFTSDDCKSKVVIDGKYTFTVSDKLTEQHKTQIMLSQMNITKKTVPFIIEVTDSLGNTFKSEQYEFEMPGDIQMNKEEGSNFLLLCLFGGTVFALPSPTAVMVHGKNYFSLTKEIPVVSIRGGFVYPAGYFSAEYSHTFNGGPKNLFRLGYKHIFPVPVIEYVSPGLNWFTNFKGFNGISPEFSFGLFRIFNAFTVYTRYRYNFKPGESGTEFHEISVGLYSSFFSLYF